MQLPDESRGGLAADLVDSHLHLVDLDRFRYYWMKPEFTVLQRNFMPEDVGREYAAQGVAAAVVVQAHPSLEESLHLVELTRRHPHLRAVVAHLDLTRRDVRRDLERLLEHPPIVGVRHQAAEGEAEDWFLRPDVLEGLRAVAESGLRYDLLIRAQQLPSIPRLLERVPELKVVLEHLAKPPIASGRLRPWADDLERLARFPSVVCKLSELVTQADPRGWTVEDLKPYVRHALECFGPDRLMWGSGWPVCLLAADFRATLESTVAALGPLPVAELRRIFRENALEFYGLA